MIFEEDYFQNEFGLSCVEDYVIYVLSRETYNWKCIFYKSYFDIEEIINYLLFKGQEYSSIKFIERIQNTLVNDGMLELVQMNLEDIERIDSKQIFLMELNESATKELLNINAWRNDHYIMCCKNTNGLYTYVNDRPYLTGNFESAELKKYIGREHAFSIRVIHKNIGSIINRGKIVQLEQKLKSQVILSGNLYLGFGKIRDSIGIYRVVVKRLQAFFCAYGTDKFIEDEIKRLDNIYLRLEYMNIRKNHDLDKVIALVGEATGIQKNVKKKALERMNIVYEQCR